MSIESAIYATTGVALVMALASFFTTRRILASESAEAVDITDEKPAAETADDAEAVEVVDAGSGMASAKAQVAALAEGVAASAADAAVAAIHEATPSDQQVVSNVRKRLEARKSKRLHEVKIVSPSRSGSRRHIFQIEEQINRSSDADEGQKKA